MKRLMAVATSLIAFSVIGTSGVARADDQSGRPHGPPPGAIEACAKLAAGDACSVTFNDHTMEGTCRTGPDGNGPLACAPKHHGPPPEAFEACRSLSAGAACTVTHHDHTMTGTCKTGPDGKGALACHPDHPPGPPPAK